MKNIMLATAVILFCGCVTIRATGQDKPENRFGTGYLVALPSIISCGFGFIPGCYAFGVGWAWGMSGVFEGCQKQKRESVLLMKTDDEGRGE